MCLHSHSNFFLDALLGNLFPALKDVCFRNDDAKGIERLNSLMKSLGNWRLKPYEDDSSFTCLFIQTLKYMTRKCGIKKV